MFSKSLIVGAVALAFVTVGWFTVQSVVVTPVGATSATAASDPGYQVNLINWFQQHGGSGYRDDASNDAADNNADAVFTKWVTTAGTAPVIFNMAGLVSGDVGGGKYAGEVINLDQSTPGVTKIEALYHMNGGTHQFTADLNVTQDDKKGTATIKGVVTEGWLKGAEVQGEYTVIAPCGIINAQQGVFGDACFQGTLHVQGSKR